MAQYNHSVVMHLGRTNKWIIDTGATDHVTSDPRVFDELCDYVRDPYITSANGALSPVKGECTISLTPTLSLVRALLVPDVKCNLLSVGKLLDTLYCSAHFYPTDSEFKCETCVMDKSHRASFPVSDSKATLPFDLIHSDVWGPAKVTYNGFRWFVTFIDDCTRVTWVFLMKNKSDVPLLLQEFCTMVSTQFQTTVKVFRSDNGGEYVNHTLACFFGDHGIIHQTTTPFTPQQNGVFERKNRQIMEVARSLMLDKCVPNHLWGHAVLAAVYLINRVPSRVLDFQTPFDVLQKHVSLVSVSKLPPKVFGCIAYVHVYSHQRSKLDACALRCVFIGYANNQKGYKCYHPPTQKTYITMDVTFHEEVSYFVKPSSDSPLQGEMGSEVQIRRDDMDDVLQTELGTEPIILRDTNQSTTDDDRLPAADISDELPSDDRLPAADMSNELPDDGSSSDDSSNCLVQDGGIHEVNSDDSSTYQLPPRANRGKPKVQYEPDMHAKAKYPIKNYVSSHRLSQPYASYICQLSSVSIPTKLQDALSDPKWVNAMKVEMEALEKNSTWDLVPLPNGKKAVGCRWVFTIKHKADGSIDRYKARLVAKGYTQTYGVDYQETFAPVAKLNTVRVLLSLAANQDWPLLQFDVKNAFLHGDLKEEVYMDLPPGIGTSPGKGIVCRLRKALYGLKQSPRAWFGRFTSSMKKFGYIQSHSDHTLFLKRQNGKLTALIIYVDDMIVTGDDQKEIQHLQKYLATEFEMKELGELGELKYFLGIEVARSKHGIFLSQRKYVLDLLAETGMLDCKPVDTPIEQNHRLGLFPDQFPTHKERYQRLVGRLIYLSHTRPDIAYAISVVSQFMHSPSKAHMDAVTRILRYLKMAHGRGLFFSKNDHLNVEGYTDADWAGSITDRRSTFGYFMFVGGNLVTWRSKKQKVVARSSAEAEFRGMSHGVCELLWLEKLLRDLGFKHKGAMKLHCDNKAAIEIAHNPVQHDRTKHVEIDRHFIKEKLDAGIIMFPFVRSEDQLADALTKAVSNSAFSDSLDKLGMRDIFAPT
ncbi:hypothetical protein ACFXTO_029686 [Malus domestica]